MTDHNERITLGMTTLQVAKALSDGNPGALRVITEILTSAHQIDPDAALGSLAPLLALDTLGCYGPRIWMLYEDVCGQNLNRMIAVLRAKQLGYLSADRLNLAIDGVQVLDLAPILAQVKERLPRFFLDDPEAQN